MQGIDPFEQFEQSYRAEILKREACVAIQQKLEDFCQRLEKIQNDLKRLNTPDDDMSYRKLQVRLKHYRHQLKQDVPKLAEKLMTLREPHLQKAVSEENVALLGQVIEERRQEQDREEAESQLSKRHWEEIEQKRHEQKQRLLERIVEQENFFEAAELAIEVNYLKEDLKAINALAEVVDALLHQLNVCNQQEKEIVLLGTPEHKLREMCKKAEQFRSHRGFLPLRAIADKKSGRPRLEKLETIAEADPYQDLKGKVVVFGGHITTKAQVKDRLPNVNLVWCSLEDGERIAKQTVEQIATADLVMILTDDTKHKVTNIVEPATKRAGKKLIRLHKEGQNTILSQIALGLKFKK